MWKDIEKTDIDKESLNNQRITEILLPEFPGNDNGKSMTQNEKVTLGELVEKFLF